MTIFSALFYRFFLVICVLAPLALDPSPKSLMPPPFSGPLHTAWNFFHVSFFTQVMMRSISSDLASSSVFSGKTSLTFQMRSVSILHLLCFLCSSHRTLVLVDIYEHGHSPTILEAQAGEISVLSVFLDIIFLL